MHKAGPNLLAEQNDPAGAAAANQRAIESGHTDAAAEAAAGLGQLLEETGDTTGAQAAYQEAIESQHPEWAPWSAGKARPPAFHAG